MGWRKSSLIFVLLAAVAAFVACSSEEEEKPQELDKQACKLIANRCHPYDVDGGEQIAHDCHETGHNGKSIEACNAIKAECLAACPERDAGHTGGSGGTGSDAAPDSTGSGGVAGSDSGSDAPVDASVDAAGSGGTGGSGGTAGSAGTGGSAGYGGSAGTACEQLASKCHGLGPGLTEECHEIGHNEDEPACELRWAECIAVCNHPG